MKNKDINLQDIPAAFNGFVRGISAYKVFVFFLAAASLYGYIIWRINTFSNAPADSNEESSQTTAQPHIDPATVAKIQSLQDNSVSVQTLFDNARQNPFQE